MQPTAVRGYIEHDPESGAYVLTASGRGVLAGILEHAGSTLRRNKLRRLYKPRVVGSKVMMPADLVRLHNT